VASLVKRLSSARRDNTWVRKFGKFLECRQFLQQSEVREHQPLLKLCDKSSCSSEMGPDC